MDASPSSVKSERVILLGVGFTTSRVAKRLLLRGVETWAAVRQPEKVRHLAAVGLRVQEIRAEGFPAGATLIHTVPPPAPELSEFIRAVAPSRVVYISSTGVYGNQIEVNESTAAQPCERLAEEDWIRGGPWESLVLRPAAIYGPGRGVHMRVLEGKLARGAGSGVTSRIHVDDLAAITEAGALSDVTGEWPCADLHPCSSEEISRWCARLLRIEESRVPAMPQVSIPQSGRRVDGRAILNALDLTLIYPGYESGILASVAASAVS